MRNIFITALFLLASLAWATAQSQAPGSQGSMPPGQAGQSTAPPSMPSDSQQQTSPSTGQSTTSGSSAQTPAADGTVVEGCLGGTNPNFTVTDKAGVAYKLNVPPGTDVSVLSKHVGESVQVAGAVNDAGHSGSTSSSSSSATGTSASSGKGEASINVTRIGRGNSSCPGSAASQGSATPQAAPPKQ